MLNLTLQDCLPSPFHPSLHSLLARPARCSVRDRHVPHVCGSPAQPPPGTPARAATAGAARPGMTALLPPPPCPMRALVASCCCCWGRAAPGRGFDRGLTDMLLRPMPASAVAGGSGHAGQLCGPDPISWRARHPHLRPDRYVPSCSLIGERRENKRGTRHGCRESRHLPGRINGPPWKHGNAG
jgi:hypothetical protein